jgi:transposase
LAEAAMMGRQTADQGALFYEFRLEDRVPEGHLLRRINAVITPVFAGLHQRLAPYYSSTGRPSIDPELMIRMLIIGYCHGIRSERRLCEEVALNLAYRWFCRLDLNDAVPDHSSFSKNRHGRFRESDLLRQIFEAVARACMATGLVKGEGFAVDASIIGADASRHHRIKPDEADWSKPERQTRAVREYLAALEAAAPDPARKTPEVLSPSDPAAAWTAKTHLQVQFAYGLNYLIDMDNAIIVDVEATPARVYDEVRATRTMLSRTRRQFGLKPKHLAGDTAYGTGTLLGWLVGQRIAPHIPVWDKSQRQDGTFSRKDFRFDKKGAVYFCPQGKILETTGRLHGGTTLLYRASKYDCTPCPLKANCCPNTPERKIPRDVNEAARDKARALAETEAFQRSCNDRRKIEMRFAHLKTHHGFNRLRLRGLSGARDEFHLAAIAQNLKTLARRMG